MPTDYYHVSIVRKAEHDAITQLDYTLEDLKKEIIQPYQDRREILCNGYRIRSDNIDNIRISKSVEPSSVLIPRIKEEIRRESEVTGFGSVASIEWYVVDKTQNVTKDLIKDVTPWHDKMQICLQGHIINTSFTRRPERNKANCDICGNKTITECPSCRLAIRGDLHVPHYEHIGTNTIPLHCQKCGKEFPWKNLVKSGFLQRGISTLSQLLQNFNEITRPLRNRRKGRQSFSIQNEYDVQDLLHVLLKTHYNDVRPEEWTPSYAGGSSKMDFLLKDEKIVVEAKMTRDDLTDKKLGEELLVDIAKYEGSCETLVCFIYDPDERIANRQGLKKDLEKKSSDKLRVIVIIHP